MVMMKFNTETLLVHKHVPNTNYIGHVLSVRANNAFLTP